MQKVRTDPYWTPEHVSEFGDSRGLFVLVDLNRELWKQSCRESSAPVVQLVRRAAVCEGFNDNVVNQMSEMRKADRKIVRRCNWNWFLLKE